MLQLQQAVMADSLTVAPGVAQDNRGWGRVGRRSAGLSRTWLPLAVASEPQLLGWTPRTTVSVACGDSTKSVWGLVRLPEKHKLCL